MLRLYPNPFKLKVLCVVTALKDARTLFWNRMVTPVTTTLILTTITLNQTVEHHAGSAATRIMAIAPINSLTYAFFNLFSFKTLNRK